ncbi:MAG TPA: aldo/keto reductase [Geminicoccus sp.]|uniref:aldo/keto reductase n=1 Tax=Geminicoccus sp. TaxID=2024832 RepID=UPI002E33381E|nr:aldo/keto reductase [Geminicoccus sp.]HEX2526330.1 aldo/keto reductase [Geminicoccus sp.]
MASSSSGIERIDLAPGLNIPRVVTGLWQVADIERGAGPIDPDEGATALAAYMVDGFDAFDMADHYGSAEVLAGRLRERLANGTLEVADQARLATFTKWCPEPGEMTREVVQIAVDRACKRLHTDRIDLLQFHWWMFEHPAWLDAMRELAKLREEGRIAQLGVTNVDTDHLRVLVAEGIPVATNQVCVSLLDRRATEEMSVFCQQHGIRLLAYGTLAGGFLSKRWLGAEEPDSVGDWSKMKYRRFVEAAGGWDVLQGILQALDTVARKHGVSISNVATRWVMQQPAVAAVIVGARLGEREHRGDNLRLCGFSLDDEDMATIGEALAIATRIPGDCGDEYRRPPFLTASGDLSHHLDQVPPVYQPAPIDHRTGRIRVDSGSVWEPICGYSRAVRVGDRILVSGTTATHSSGEMIGKGDPAAQAVYILDKIAASIRSLGGKMSEVVRTRIYLRNADDWEKVSRVHGHYFGQIRPANTLLEVSRLIGDYDVEIEAEAVVEPPPAR